MPTARISRCSTVGFYDIVSTVFYSELSRDMAMKIGREYSSEKVLPRDFEQMARATGLSPALVKRRVPELAQTVMAALPTIKTLHPVSEKVAALIHQRSENVFKALRAPR
jgi:serine/threonine-protein kinase HipA